MNAQLVLFAMEAPAKAIVGGGPPHVMERMEFAFTEPVKLDLLAVAAARPDEWLDWQDFAGPREKYDIGFCMGHVLFALVREVRLQEKIIYLGKGLEADRPGSPDYQGFKTNWKIA